MKQLFSIIFIPALLSVACLTPNNAYLDFIEPSAESDTMPEPGETDPDIENPKSKSEGLAYMERLECPEPSERNCCQLIIKTDSIYGVNYAIEWDWQLRAQRWSAMQMYHGNSANNVRRSGDDAWHEDDQIPAEYRTTYADHYQNGYDRGHMIASADRLQSRAMNKQTFVYSNVHPQLNELNAGIWMEMEEKLRTWNCDEFRDTLYVAKGGTIDSEAQILGYTTSGLIIPKYFWMAVLCIKDGKYKAVAFWIDHRRKYSKAEHVIENHFISIAQLETFTGINFFYNLDPDIQEKVKAEVDLSYWK